MVFEQRSEHPSQRATIRSVSSTFGMSAETLRDWVGEDRGLLGVPHQQVGDRDREPEQMDQRGIGHLGAGIAGTPDGHPCQRRIRRARDRRSRSTVTPR